MLMPMLMPGCNTHCKCWFGSPTCRSLAQDAPKVLVLQLKRFEYSVYSRHKVTKKIDYQTSLDLAPFMSKPGAGSLVSARLLDVPALQPYSLTSGPVFAVIKLIHTCSC